MKFDICMWSEFNYNC